MKHLFLFLSIIFLLASCKEEGCMHPYASNYNSDAEEEDCSCIHRIDEMEGTYLITVTSYPWQPAQEGEEFDALVFSDHVPCSSYDLESVNFIKFNNLFTFYECDRYPLDKFTFTVTLDHNDYWSGAPIEGVGSIINEVFHFEGIVHTSQGEYPITLDGNKISDDRRTDAC